MSAHPAEQSERGTAMKDNYNFSKGRRGRVVAEPPPEPGKIKITIRLDEDLIDHFSAIADRSGGKAGYQTLINWALREYVERKTQNGAGTPQDKPPCIIDPTGS